MNKLIMIGNMGDFRCYLNMEKDDVVEKYLKKIQQMMKIIKTILYHQPEKLCSMIVLGFSET